jgi:hypothetical protein
VLSWDGLEFRRSAEAIEKAKGGSSPSKEQLAAIKDYVRKPRSDHDNIRKDSMQSEESMVATIMKHSNPALLDSLSEAQHAQCSEYLAALLDVRDRDEIVIALCRQTPDLFTQAIKDAVASFEPMIRAVHQRVDLREHVSAAEGFITDFINVTKAKKGTSGLLGSLTPSKSDTSEIRAPSVEDYVLLLRNNRQLLYNWFHQVASQCPEIRDDFCAWAIETIKVFRQSSQPSSKPEPGQAPKSTDSTTQRPGAAGSLSTHLQHLFGTLPVSTQRRILPTIDAHATYLSRLEALSLTRMQRILDNLPTITSTTAATTPAATAPASYFNPSYWSRSTSSTPRSPRSPALNPPPSTAEGKTTPKSNLKSFSGPGMYLSRWQHLLDETVISPSSLSGGGSLRKGRNVKGVVARGKTTSTSTSGGGGTAGGGKDGGWDSGVLRGLVEEEEREAGVERAVDVRCVVEALGEGFRGLVGGFVDGTKGELPAEGKGPKGKGEVVKG